MDTDKIYNLFFAALCAGAGLFGAVMFINSLLMRINGGQAVCRIISHRSDGKGSYFHKVSFSADGKEVTAEDRAGYSQPFSDGEEILVYYKKSEPERFQFAHENRMKLLTFGLLGLFGVLLALRFYLA